jgi:tetratricopeptide (TPR) repeat protein
MEDLAGAEETLEHAVALADRAGDAAARGAAANVLGLARLANGHEEAAADAFRIAVAGSPRSLRPEAFAIGKANLALTYERLGSPARARLAARQALAVADVPLPVGEQARGVLERLGAAEDDLRVALEEEPEDGLALLAREELLRSADATDEQCAADMRAWISTQASSSQDPANVAELWLGGLLELPADALERLVRASVKAAMSLRDEERNAFRSDVQRALARFHVPQMMRLQDLFARAAADAGDRQPWR